MRKIIAGAYILFPLSYLVLSVLFFDIPANQIVLILLRPYFYIVSIAGIIAGLGLWDLKRWSWYVFLLTNPLIIYENAVLLSEFGETHHKSLAFLASLVFLGFIVYRMSFEMRTPYYFPKIRWWESESKYRFNVGATISLNGKTLLEGDIVDLSTKGCFIRHGTGAIPVQEFVKLNFKLGDQELECAGKAVWNTDSTVTLPRGTGIQFGKMSRKSRKNIRIFLKNVSTQKLAT